MIFQTTRAGVNTLASYVIAALVTSSAGQTPPASDRELGQLVASGVTVEMHGQQVTAATVGTLIEKTKGGVRLSRAQILGDLRLFNKTAPGALLFTNCVFNGNIDMRKFNAQMGLSILGCHVLRDADLTDIQVTGAFSIASSHFHQATFLNGAAVSSDFFAERAVFDGHFGAVEIRCGSSMYFNRATFLGFVNFSKLSVVRELRFIDCNFTANPVVARRIDPIGRFDLGWERKTFRDLDIQGNAFFRRSTFDSPPDLSGSHFRRNLLFESCTNRDSANTAFPADFAVITVDGRAAFSNAVFECSLNLSDATLRLWDIDHVHWPTNPGTIMLDGFSFNRVVKNSKSVHFDDLLPVLTAQVKGSIIEPAFIKYFESRSEKEDALRIFHWQKRRQREDLWNSGRRLAWFLEWVLKLTVDNGKGPERAFWWSLAFITLGTVIFRDPRGEKMEQQKDSDRDRSFSPFWYSLDLFTPAIDLQSATNWKPKTTAPRWINHYLRIHRVIGWTLIPIGVAALTGFVK